MSAASARRSVAGMVHNAHERLAKLERERPRLYAARHMAKGVGADPGRVLIALGELERRRRRDQERDKKED
jgi:hypothetical protein